VRFAARAGGQQVELFVGGIAADCGKFEVAAVDGMPRQDGLRLTRRLESLHASLSFSSRSGSPRIFCPIAREANCPMPHIRPLVVSFVWPAKMKREKTA
jgi:hypothetical protein